MDSTNEVITPESPTLSAAALGDWFGWVIVELAPDGIAVTDESGQIVLTNRRLSKQFGHSRSAMVGQRVEHLMPVRFRAGHMGHRHDYNDLPTPRAMGVGSDLTGLHVDGTEFPIEVSLSPISTASGMHTVVIVRDRTDYKAEEARVRSSEEVVVLEYVSARLDAAVNMIHDAGMGLAGVVGLVPESEEAKVMLAIASLDRAVGEVRHAALARPPEPTWE